MKLLLQTARPITLFAWIPPFVGSLLGGGLSPHTLTACLSTVMAVGLINIHNNQTDRRIDRHNVVKDTLALRSPIRNHQLVTVYGASLAIVLRQVGYNYLLLSVLYYVGVFYNLVLSRLPVVKRVVVALTVAATSFLAVDKPNLYIWLWAIATGTYIYLRESRKDRADAREDQMVRFFKRDTPVDLWCILAPFAGVATYLGSAKSVGAVLTATHLVVSLGIALTIFSFMQIRARHGWYKMWFPHRLIAGQSGLTLALAALMPPFAYGIMPIVVFNLTTIYVRSCLPARINLKWWANLHDAYLWASLVLLAMAGPGVFSLAAVIVSLLLLAAIFLWELQRIRRWQAV